MRRASTTALALLAAACLAAGFASRAAAADDSAAEGQAPRAFTRVPAPNGIEIRRFNETDGAKPGRTDRVRVHYQGTFKDGRVFDSSIERGQPATFPLNRVIPCWTEAVTRLRVGEKAEVVCPPETAYGARGAPPTIPPNATLTFEIELLGIE